MNEYIDTLIVSDLHLGTPLSRANDLCSFLQETNFRRLILLGDIFDDQTFVKLTPDHWRLLSLLSELNLSDGKEIVWVRGNHDKRISGLMSELIDIPVCEKYVWRYRGKKMIAIHGDQFDRFLVNNAAVHKLITYIYRAIGYWGLEDSYIAKTLQSFRTTWLGLSEGVARGALNYCIKERADAIFCGHTHIPIMKEVIKNDRRVSYYNAGCWLAAPATYVAIDKNGIHLKTYKAVEIMFKRIRSLAKRALSVTRSSNTYI